MSFASDAYSVEIVRSTSFTAQLRQGFNMLHVPCERSAPGAVERSIRRFGRLLKMLSFC